MTIQRLALALLVLSAACSGTADHQSITLTVSGAGTGSGRIVAVSQGAIDCRVTAVSVSGDCAWGTSHPGLSHGSFTVAGLPDQGSQLVSWTGCGERVPPNCEAQWPANRNVRVHVVARFDLLPPPGIQSVAISPAPGPLDVGGTAPLNATVTLESGATGTPSVFWSSADPLVATVTAGPANSTTVTAAGPGATTITATATLQLPGGGTSTKTASVTVIVNTPAPAPSRVTIRVVGAGDGTGTIQSSGLPGGALSCTFPSAGICEIQVDQPQNATTFTITATATGQSTFTSWDGCASVPLFGVCTLSIGGQGSGNARVVTARFNQPGISVRISVSLSGQGTGTVSGAGLNCSSVAGGGSICTVNLSAADGPGTVALAAVPGSNPAGVFRSWGGDCVVAGSACQLVWDSDVDVTRQVSATFDLPPAPPPPPPPPPFLGPGDVIVFDLTPPGGPADLYLQASSSLTRLIQTPGPRTEPVWSPDATSIAFRSKRDDSRGEIHVITVATLSETRITQNAGTNDDPDFDHDPAWSSDGTKVLFVSYRTGDDEIWIMNADGTGTATNLTNRAGDQYSPAMSPDGTRILFVDLTEDDGPIMVMDANGTNQRALLGNPIGGEPAWSPDGTRIAFTRGSSIWMMNADGTAQEQLTFNNIDDEPAWSPDGTRIVFSRGQDGNKQLWGIRLSDRTTVLVSSSAGSSEHPSWRR